MQAFVRLVKDAMMCQLNKLQVCADGEIFTIGKGQENLVAHRLAIRIGSFTRLHWVHVSPRQIILRSTALKRWRRPANMAYVPSVAARGP
jgi:hypothetical protein